jgi:hypothetical protein
MVKRKNERSLIPLLIVSSVVAAPLIFILGAAFGSQIQISNILTADSLSSWVAALATVAIAILTFVLAKETWYLREAQIEQVNELRRENIRPNVSVNLSSSPIDLSFMNIRIQNHGKGIARNIRFSFIDREQKEINLLDSAIVDEFLKLHVFSEGINSLGLDQKIESFLFSFYDIKKNVEGSDIFSPYFKIKIHYEDVEGTPYFNELTMDFKEYKGITSVGGGDPLHKIADDIKKLREQFGRVTTHNRINIDTYTSSDRDQQRVKIDTMLEERKTDNS